MTAVVEHLGNDPVATAPGADLCTPAVAYPSPSAFSRSLLRARCE